MTGNRAATPTVALAADHGGVELKARLGEHLAGRGVAVVDLGTGSADPVDYPDYGFAAAEAVRTGKADVAILLCKSGIGMSIAANKAGGIRAALAGSVEDAEMSRRHNDANVLVLGAVGLPFAKARRIVDAWLDTPFEGGRHVRRLDKIRRYEEAHWKE